MRDGKWTYSFCIMQNSPIPDTFHHDGPPRLELGFRSLSLSGKGKKREREEAPARRQLGPSGTVECVGPTQVRFARQVSGTSSHVGIAGAHVQFNPPRCSRRTRCTTTPYFLSYWWVGPTCRCTPPIFALTSGPRTVVRVVSLGMGTCSWGADVRDRSSVGPTVSDAWVGPWRVRGGRGRGGRVPFAWGPTRVAVGGKQWGTGQAMLYDGVEGPGWWARLIISCLLPWSIFASLFFFSLFLFSVVMFSFDLENSVRAAFCVPVWELLLGTVLVGSQQFITLLLSSKGRFQMAISSYLNRYTAHFL